jgi:hypothetical protein
LLAEPHVRSVIPFDEDEESWPNEPDEFDPDSLGPDPPDAAGSNAPGGTADVSDDLAGAFWASVLFVNVALGALSIGAMLIYFRGNHGAGLLAIAIGLVATLGFARYYRNVRAGRYTDGDAEDVDGDADGGASRGEVEP